MVHAIRVTFSPSRYRFGRVVAMICLVYLGLVLCAAAFATLDAATRAPEDIGASFSAVPLLILTAPTSLLFTELLSTTPTTFPAGGGDASHAHALRMCLLVGVLMGVAACHAAGLFLLARGPVVVPPHDRA